MNGRRAGLVPEKPSRARLTPAQADLVRLLASIAVERLRREAAAGKAEPAAQTPSQSPGLAMPRETRR